MREVQRGDQNGVSEAGNVGGESGGKLPKRLSPVHQGRVYSRPGLRNRADIPYLNARAEVTVGGRQKVLKGVEALRELHKDLGEPW